MIDNKVRISENKGRAFTSTTSKLKHYKPTSPGVRGKISVDRRCLWNGSPLKSLTKRIASGGGRNFQGKITIRHRKAYSKQIYRIISFKRAELNGINAVVDRVEYDPNRTANIALLKYSKDGQNKFCYIVAPKGLKTGDVISTSFEHKIDQNIGNCMKLKYIKAGTMLYCVELKIGKGACIARSAGACVRLVGIDDKGRSIIKMPSGESKAINQECTACIGSASNENHSNIYLGKAGANYHRGIRPSVRGIAMNPVDHHNGGRANGGCIFASPTGLCAKGKKTRRNKRTLHTIIKRREK